MSSHQRDLLLAFAIAPAFGGFELWAAATS